MGKWPNGWSDGLLIGTSMVQTIAIVGMLAYCLLHSKWLPGGDTGEVKNVVRNWPPYFTMQTAEDNCHL